MGDGVCRLGMGEGVCREPAFELVEGGREAAMGGEQRSFGVSRPLGQARPSRGGAGAGGRGPSRDSSITWVNLDSEYGTDGGLTGAPGPLP